MQLQPTIFIYRFSVAPYGSDGVFPGMFWGKILLASINETRWPGILAIVLFAADAQTKDMIRPLKHSAGALRGAVYVYRAEDTRSRPVR